MWIPECETPCGFRIVSENVNFRVIWIQCTSFKWKTWTFLKGTPFKELCFNSKRTNTREIFSKVGLSIPPTLHLVIFRKMHLQEWGSSPGFLWLLILLSVASFLKISLKFLKSFGRYEDFLCQHNYFYQFFGFFWHFLVTKKLLTSAYNRWCQHFFTFNLL